MPRPVWSKPAPWIESLIQSYGAEDGGSSRDGKYLEAHVTAVGEMTQSQAVSCRGHTGLLFLSDGVVQVPAILTAAAWELLQEQEEKECFSSLVGTTVFIRNYRLQFHMAVEQTKSRFFLSVGELATKSVSPMRVMTPCCTTLPSVQLKIIRTWESLLGQEDSQKSQSHLDLSDLLGEWQLDCLESVLQDVRERLARARDAAQQPSTSSTISNLDTPPAPSWDVDRIRYKGSGTFSIPTQYLLIPEEAAQLRQRQTPCTASSKSTSLSVGGPDQQITELVSAEREPGNRSGAASPVQGIVLLRNAVSGIMADTTAPLANPWDIFPPPCDTSTSTSSSDGAEGTTPVRSAEAPITPKCPPQQPATSTQLPASSLKEPHSFLPPYQKPALSANVLLTPPESLAGPPSADQSSLLNQNITSSDQESRLLEKDGRTQKCGKAKRKRSEPVAEDVNVLLGEEAEEVEMSRSPPSWLFESQGGSAADEASLQYYRSTRKHPRKTPTAHSNGAPFKYTYQVSGQNLQDFSRFKVADSMVRWALKYLLAPKETHISSEAAVNTSSP